MRVSSKQPATHRKPAMSLNSEAIVRGQPGHHMSTHQKLIIAGTKYQMICHTVDEEIP